MNRKAFLIGSPMIKGDSDYLPGVTPDIVNMKNHLFSNKGGAWDNHEIVIFENPSRDDLFSKIRGNYDFAIIQYSGHGFEHENTGTTININPYENVSLNEIHNLMDCPKRYYFIDCCRGIVPEEFRRSTKLFSAMESDDSRIRMAYKTKYKNILSSCEKGTSIIYSCGLNESADEDDRGLGGIFSLGYFLSANSIRNIPEDKYYSIKNIFELARERMKNDYPMTDQNPMMKPERRNRYFPFLI